MLLRLLIFLHRWVGIAICVIFLIWFPSGIGMMYWTYPSVSPADQLERSPALEPAKVVLSPAEAAEKLGIEASPGQIRLGTFDGRPVYRLSGGGRGGRGGRGGSGGTVYADTGEQQTDVPHDMRDRIAAAWTGRPASEARIEPVEDVDQWTIQSRNIRPLYKYSWPNGEQLYIAGSTGDVIQYTTAASRLAAHVSAIPHWLYYTPLRKHQPVWIRLMIWVSLIGTISTIIGIAIGVWMYSPSRKYRLAGKPTGIPYRGQKRWHTIFGLVFGIATATWAFSGLLSLGPFPIIERLQGSGGQRRNSGQEVAAALRGRVQMTDFASTHPRDLLAKVSNLPVKELEFTSFDGKPVFAANLGAAGTRMITLDGAPIEQFNHQEIVDLVKKAAPDPDAVQTRLVEQYDLYYLDRTRQRPLPVILVLMNDADKTRYYIDPTTARVVGTYSNRNWINRWLYNGLHSLNFPWLYNYRPLWDIVVITFMIGGTALCVTSLVLAWRVLGRKLRRAAQQPNDVLAPVS